MRNLYLDAWSLLLKGLGRKPTPTKPERQHRPWTMSRARENARRVRQAERLAEKRAGKGGA